MAKKKSNLKTKKPIIKTSVKKKTVKKASKKNLNSKNKTNSKTVKKSTKVKQTSKVLKNVKKKVTAKKKKEIQKVKSKPNAKVEKKVIKKTKKKLEKKPKKVVSFDNHIKDVVAKLLDKHKVDGIYTTKIIEKAVPKKFRIPENILKVEEFLKNNKITIVSEKEAAALAKTAKEEL